MVKWRAARATNLPALTQQRWLRYVAFSVLYAAQGLPYGFIVVALPAFLAERGLSAAQIGSFIGIALLPVSMKLLVAPLMDRWSFLPMGRRRPWVLAAQLGMALSFAAFALVAQPLAHLTWLTIAGFAAYFFIAFQDVAVDGMAIDVVPLQEQARTNGVMRGSMLLGMSGSTAGVSWLLNHWGLPPTALLVSGMMVAIMVVPLLLRERPGERLLPWSSGEASAQATLSTAPNWKSIGRNLVQVLVLPSSLALAGTILACRAASGLLEAALTVITVQELGWQDTTFTQLNASGYLAAGLIGMLLGGRLVDTIGRKRAMTAAALVLMVATVLLGAGPHLWPERGVVSSYIIAYLLLDMVFTIGFYATAMALCAPRVAATQFALYMALSNFAFSVGASRLGILKDTFGSAHLLFWVAGGLALGALLLQLIQFNVHRQRLDALEK
ncbi:MFS transporter, PAT family, beta-lactamase induction signal transducer AmpG [Catalinimonas alkaloidigena]|uniref:MFS transporter, PAT family, beta-lactamase induction signal transducer AmpG n=2 Tax=Catalinimonas alkaloidigena TaxID=1075417 RepID=A0A1G9RPX3_9BACT|nr:MFS transporter, PAT family, beta-lactamase induction signal transducer AmpG [Catalinimonas alkaloidigena]